MMNLYIASLLAFPFISVGESTIFYHYDNYSYDADRVSLPSFYGFHFDTESISDSMEDHFVLDPTKEGFNMEFCK